MSKLSRKQQTQKRHRRLRRHITGTPDRPRLAVFRSNNHMYAQVIDDAAQSTLCSASTVDKELRTGLKAPAGSCDASVAVGELACLFRFRLARFFSLIMRLSGVGLISNLPVIMVRIKVSGAIAFVNGSANITLVSIQRG